MPRDDLRRLRALRNRPERDLSIAAAVKQAEQEAKKRYRAVGGIGAAWESLVPPDLRSRCAPVSFARGLLTIRAGDAGARFELDRFLRSGGQAALAREANVAIKRVKIE